MDPQLEEKLKELREKLAKVPHLPGVYLHKDNNGNILYVGKAKNLQARLKSYFTATDRLSQKTWALVRKINEFEIIIVDNEHESLVLENNLIKHHRPPYNVLLRDDKTYPYFKITMNEKWPRVLMTRQRRQDGALYFGPYANGSHFMAIRRLIHRFFPLVKCTANVFNTVSRPCNYYHIKQCLGPCKLEVDEKEYRKLVNQVVVLLEGNAPSLVQDLKKEMQKASLQMQFEKAASIRDQVRALDSLNDPQAVTLPEGIEFDVIGSFWHKDIVSFHVVSVRDGKVVGGQGHIVKILIDELEQNGESNIKKNIASTFVSQYYQNKYIPEKIWLAEANDYLDEETAQSLSTYLSNISNRNDEGREKIKVITAPDFPLKTRTRSNDREKFKEVKKVAFENARNRFQDEIEIDEKSKRNLLGMQTFLGLDHMPVWLECFDISTFQGAETVASQVVFKDGRPAKAQYRRYIIKDVVGQDDFASMREVIRRRFREERRHEIPDLIIIDGGEPQIREVGRILKSLGLDEVQFVGLAKSRTKRDFTSSQVTASTERIVIPRRNEKELLPDEPCETRLLSTGSGEYQIFTQIRNEAHRFAITFHRERRDKQSKRSILSSIPGLGPKRRKELMTAFPTFKEIREATAQQLHEKTKFPLKVVLKIKEVLADSESEELKPS